ncbi:unnamed protein product [Eruca vesicaria subsp. sativa]|uniref:Uncharacterized protein n=1 Tax=Eruca vesicaria subsp. sativa TaxID=29727 RepID=A0ABC8KZ51_ERUVS|nr:unnamed protein product [Eruca vesicaria subsp. sativa]
MVIAEDSIVSRSDLVDDRFFLSLPNYGEIEKRVTKKSAFLTEEFMILVMYRPFKFLAKTDRGFSFV